MASNSLHVDGLIVNKFPRTPHLTNLGAVTRDDLVMDMKDVESFLTHDLLCEEKVDGANLGISFDAAGCVRLQKRGHWITPDSEPQYAKLTGWLERYAAPLRHALGSRRVLFGEWLVARHSLAYDQLPGWFVAFDVLDEGAFLDSASRNALLEATGVPVVRSLGSPRRFTSLPELVAFLHDAQSAYMSVPSSVEGLYLRVEAHGRVVARAKLVHPGFLQCVAPGSVHWSRRTMQLNVVRADVWQQQQQQQDQDLRLEHREGQQEAAPQVNGNDSPGTASPADAPGAPTSAAGTADGGASIVLHRGSVCLVGPMVDELARATLNDQVPLKAQQCRLSRDGAQYHLTMLTAQELEFMAAAQQHTPQQVLASAVEQVDTRGWVCLGLAMCRDNCRTAAYYAVVAWPSCRTWRVQHLALMRPWDGHVTLGFLPRDVHCQYKGPGTCLSPGMTVIQAGVTNSVDTVAAILLLEAWAILQRPEHHQGMAQPLADRLIDMAKRHLSADWAPSPGASADFSPQQMAHLGSLAEPCRRAAAAAFAMEAQQAGRRGQLEVCSRCAQTAIACDASLAFAHMLYAKSQVQLEVFSAALEGYGNALACLEVAQAGSAPPALPRPPLALLLDAMSATVQTAALQRGMQYCQERLHKQQQQQTSRTFLQATQAATGISSIEDLQPLLDATLDSASDAPTGRSTSSRAANDDQGVGGHQDPAADARRDWSAGKLLLLGRAGVQSPVLNPRQRVTLTAVVVDGSPTAVLMMRNMSWLVPGQVLGSSTPTSRVHVLGLASLGVRLVLTLTEEEPLPAQWFVGTPVANVFLPVPNYEPPSVTQMDAAMHHMDRTLAAGDAVLVHCGGGKGRAGTVLACYACLYGLEARERQCILHALNAVMVAPQLGADQAVNLVRSLRPGSLETAQQEAFVRTYCKELWKRYNQMPALPLDPGPSVEHDASTTDAPAAYPSTPHLPFSPQVASDDSQLSASQCSGLLNTTLVITEKLDGGNCCMHRGQVYARSHKHLAEHPSFGTVKALAASLATMVPDHLALYGENMTAVHSIRYEALTAHFYLFAVFDIRGHEWLPWDVVLQLAAQLALHTVPVLHQGIFSELSQLSALLARLMAEPSAVGCQAPREGFVVRCAAAVPEHLFDRQVAKYVRLGHVQTSNDWRRTWQRADVCLDPASRGARPPGEDSHSGGMLPAANEQSANPDALSRNDPHASPQPSTAVAASSSSGGDAAGSWSSAQQAPFEPPRGPPVGLGAASSSRRGGPTPHAQAHAPPRQQGRWPRLLVLVGIPGSGKSTFANALVASNKRWIRVSQDDSGGRSAAEHHYTHLMMRGGPDQSVILDRCNASVVERREWLALGLISKRDTGVCAVFFDMAAAVCKQRVAARRDHPTIPFGRGAHIVDSFTKKLQAPTAAEGFDRVDVVRSFDEADTLLRGWGAHLPNVPP